VRQLEPGFPKYCAECEVSLDNQFKLDTHNQGKRHQRNLRKKELLEQYAKMEAAENISHKTWIIESPETKKRTCTLCEVEFSSAFIELSHIQGRRHKQNVKNKARGVRLIKPKPQKKRKSRPAPRFGRCEICDKTFTSLLMKKNHIVGKIHKRNCKAKGILPGQEAVNLVTESAIKIGPGCLVENKVDDFMQNNSKLSDKTDNKTDNRTEANGLDNPKVQEKTGSNSELKGETFGMSTIKQSNPSWKKQNVLECNSNNKMQVKKTIPERKRGEPPSKKLKPNAKATPTPMPESIKRELDALKKKEEAAEEFFQNYKQVATANPYRGREMYMQYEALYEAYEVAYDAYVKRYCTPYDPGLIAA